MDAYSPPPLWSFAPFVLLLLVIAVFPLVHRLAHFWERNRNKLLVSLALALVTILFYAFVHTGVRDHEHREKLLVGLAAVEQVLHHAVIADYVPFIILLFSLYTISGGILLKGDIPAHPITNCAFLGAGAVLASFIGTTGASMLLIRPVLRTNAERRHKVHTIVFFIFVVSNSGGCLTPLGDPPLFLGYLRQVPFWWTLELFWPWLLLNGALIAVYFVWDTLAYRREEPRDIVLDEIKVRPLSLHGGVNFLWLLGVVACVAVVGNENGWSPFPHAREVLLLLLTALSWFTTPSNREIRQANAFTFGAIAEVAALFIGIFICMQTPVEYLRAEGPNLPLHTPAAFFWATGVLSSFLDNAPTYVVFFETAATLSAPDPISVKIGSEVGHIGAQYLLAVSMGAVFMGANTYIGNGPNFMVKTIAEASGVKMPSFFGYMAYSAAILIPLCAGVMMVFLW
ncbi:MAG: sodium:proton antiporter [Planctomycetes bacterium]|nr:sodium:proton antiporter [Planctomycetota bacterium]